MLVQMNNFKKLGYDKYAIYVIAKRNRMKSTVLKNIMRKSKFTFYVYEDERTDFSYPSSVRPHVLKKLFSDNPDFEKETFFYIDPDVIFRKKLRFSDIEKNDTWYLSDTRAYIDSKYIKSKGNELFERMCKVVGISPEVVEQNDDNAGGAQYLMKNVNSQFWEKVESDSVRLYNLMRRTEKHYKPENPIQAWTADMWAVLWNAWYFGHETKIVKRFDFAWATDMIAKWDKVNIYHNAGAVGNGNEIFTKTKYQKSPFNQEIDCSDQYCCFNYVKEIKETEKNFENILF
jgi:hypothetical protein